jgi:hypothetical protein
MKRSRNLSIILTAAAIIPVMATLSAPAAARTAAAPASPALVAKAPAGPAADPAKAPTGPITREQVEAAAPAWVQAGVDAKPDLGAAGALALVDPGAEVVIYLGTWCGDSRREISRLWRALDGIGAGAQGGSAGSLPFTLRYIAVDETKQQPAADVAAVGLLYVPTLIVRRNGHEVGRIVERSPNGVETDLLALLQGKASGLLSASPKLAGRTATPPPPATAPAPAAPAPPVPAAPPPHLPRPLR